MSYETPKRWSDLPEGGSGSDARAASLARAARAAPAPLSTDQLAALESRVAAAPARALSWAKPVGLASLAALAFLTWLAFRPDAPPLAVRPPEPAVVVPPPLAAEPPLEAEPQPDVAPPSPAPKTHPQKAPKVAIAPLAPAPEESSLLIEARMLRSALEEMRVKHDASAAQRALDAYFARFPHGALENEALVARVDVFQALGRRDEALASLNALQQVGFAKVPRALELRVLRAELLSAKEQCVEAATAFGQCLDEPSLTGPLEERAWVGRASCRGRMGDSAGSRADLERYLEKYPEGRFAAQARAAIGK